VSFIQTLQYFFQISLEVFTMSTTISITYISFETSKQNSSLTRQILPLLPYFVQSFVWHETSNDLKNPSTTNAECCDKDARLGGTASRLEDAKLAFSRMTEENKKGLMEENNS
jgi:hypothetical protein